MWYILSKRETCREQAGWLVKAGYTTSRLGRGSLGHVDTGDRPSCFERRLWYEETIHPSGVAPAVVRGDACPGGERCQGRQIPGQHHHAGGA